MSIPVGSRKPKVLQPEPTGPPVCFRSVDPWVRLEHEGAVQAEELRP
jgi:hypothetical protein